VNLLVADPPVLAGIGGAGSRHDLFAGLIDGFTSRRASELLDLRGARCWEVDLGDAGFALWLADQVGPDGEVLATSRTLRRDLDHSLLVVRRHRMTVDDPPGRFDLVHVRWLSTVPQRRQVLATLIGALRPGGVLLVEDFVPPLTGDFVAAAPGPADVHLLRQFHRAYLRVLGDQVLSTALDDDE
jgi:hypothetical protein